MSGKGGHELGEGDSSEEERLSPMDYMRETEATLGSMASAYKLELELLDASEEEKREAREGLAALKSIVEKLGSELGVELRVPAGKKRRRIGARG